jgi:diguanylate cyclase (GGDEF)-like protein
MTEQGPSAQSYTPISSEELRPPQFGAMVMHGEPLSPSETAAAYDAYDRAKTTILISWMMEQTIKQSQESQIKDEVIRAQDEHIEHLEELTMTDSLLEISNRRKLELTYQGLVSQHPLRRHDEQIPASEANHAAIMVDVDHFGDFNNTYGHAVGDSVLKAVALAVKTSVRTRDETGRYGGEELCVLLPRTTVEEAALVAEKIRTNIQETRVGEQALHVTASLGVAELQHADDLAAGVRNADTAVYAAKNGGRNQVAIYDPSMRPPEK